MRNIVVVLTLLLFLPVKSQEITLRKGVVIDSISVNDSLAETFAIYIPTSYTRESPLPVIFIFDPLERGSRGVQLLRQAAEEQGYILAASNDITEGESLLNNVRAGTRLIEKVINFFPGSNHRVYTVGLGTGARVATVLPIIYPSIAGVIAVGDIWINTDYIEKKRDFYFIGVGGYYTPHNKLLLETTTFLNKAGVKAEFYQYDGSNEWPNSNIMFSVLGGFTLNEMQKGFKPADPVLIEKLYNADLEIVQQLLRTGKHYKAYEHLEVMEKKYSGYAKGDEIKQRLKDLGRDRILRIQNRQYTAIRDIEAENLDRLNYFFAEDVRGANFENLGWWNQQIKELQDLQESKNPAEAEMAFRLEGILGNMANSTYKNLEEENAAIDPLIFTAILQTIFDKENPRGYFNIISLSSQDGDYYTALLYLEDLLKTGYDDMESLYNIPGTLDLKLSPEYNGLIKEYLGESKYYNQ